MIMKKISILGLLISSVLTGCLKDKPNNDFSTIGTIIEIPYSGLENFGASSLKPTADTVTYSFVVNIASTYPLTSDLDVTVGVDENKLKEYNGAGGVQFELLSKTAYDFPVTKATIKAGSRQATFTISFYTKKIDPSINLMLPISILDAGGKTVSGNFGTIYYHSTANPLTIDPAYTWHFRRWNAATPGGSVDTSNAPTYDYPGLSANFSPDDGNTIEVQSGYGAQNGFNVRYVMTFDNNGGVLSNFAVRINPNDVAGNLTPAGITLDQDAEIIVADPAKSYFSFIYKVTNSLGYQRVLVDEYYK